MSHNPNDETNFERRQELQHDEEAFRLHQEEKRLRTARKSNTFFWMINTIYWLLGILQTLLIIRFFLRLFGANRENQFAQLINDLSAPFVAPFSSLFVSPTTNGATNIFDFNVVIAILAYGLLAYLIVSLLRLIFNHEF
jgi:uncharacterized protein YggT (Ycf19 family)